MTIDSSTHDLPQAGDDHAKHVKRTLEQLDTAIARLALALGLALESPADLALALNIPPRAESEDPRTRSRHEQGHMKLRGLLTLRQYLIQRCFDDVGPEVTRQLIVEVELHLQSHGFKPGADGIDMKYWRGAD